MEIISIALTEYMNENQKENQFKPPTKKKKKKSSLEIRKLPPMASVMGKSFTFP